MYFLLNMRYEGTENHVLGDPETGEMYDEETIKLVECEK